MRTSSSHKGITTLETSPRSDKRPGHRLNRPRQSPLLEEPENGQSTSGPMVHDPTGLLPTNQTCSWKTTCGPRHALATTKRRPRRKRQSRRHPTPSQNVHQSNGGTNTSMEDARKTSRGRTEATPQIDERLATRPPSPMATIPHYPRFIPLARPRKHSSPA